MKVDPPTDRRRPSSKVSQDPGGKRPRAGIEDVEFATLSYVDWFNHRRLHGEIAPGPGFTTPAALK